MSERTYVDFKALKERISMREILDHYGLTEQMEAKGDHTLVGRCPFTDSTSTTAFKANLERDIWYSFALGAGGNILDFVARMEETDVVGAANLIAAWFDTDPEAEEGREAEPARLESKQESVYAAFERLQCEEVELLVGGARRSLEEALLGAEALDEEQLAPTVGRLARWILRAYQHGYALGKMQGAIEARVTALPT